MFEPEQSPTLARGFADNARLFLQPLLMPFAAGRRAMAAGAALPLAGGPFAFSAVEATAWDGTNSPRRSLASVAELRRWADNENAGTRRPAMTCLNRLTAPRASINGLLFDRPSIMGILNVTPDSFYDGGKHNSVKAAVAKGRAMLAAGADIIDVGGESTRPGATPVGQEEELARVIPVVKALAASGARVSIDTRHAAVMRAAATVGAALINDVAALSLPGSLEAAAKTGLPVVLMHANADPRTMQNGPKYAETALEVFVYLEKRITAAEEVGIPRKSLLVDPGIGFAKTAAHNADVLENVALYHGFGCPVLLGPSRKSFIAKFSEEEAVDERLPGSIAAAIWGASQGVQILRVHDVAETAQALAVWRTASDPAGLR